MIRCGHMAVPPPPPLAFDRLEKKRLARRMQARSPGLRRAACGTVVVVVALARGPKTCDISGHLSSPPVASRRARARRRRDSERAPIHRPQPRQPTHAPARVLNLQWSPPRQPRACMHRARAAASDRRGGCALALLALGYSMGGYEYMVFWAHGSARLISMGS